MSHHPSPMDKVHNKMHHFLRAQTVRTCVVVYLLKHEHVFFPKPWHLAFGKDYLQCGIWCHGLVGCLRWENVMFE